jgi:DNA-binding beta-propeller fold protein YncE
MIASSVQEFMNAGRLVFACLVLLSPVARADRLVLVAGGGAKEDHAPATQTKLVAPFGVDFDAAANLYLVEMAGGERVRKMGRDGVLHVIAGTGTTGFAGENSAGLEAQFNGMHSLAVLPDGNLFLADTWNHRIRRVDARTGTVSTFAGTGATGYGGDGGPAKHAQFGGLYCASLDPQHENLYLADLDNRRVRAINLQTGLVRTVAGNGERGVPKDGDKAVSAPLIDPRAVAVDRMGNVYVLEREGHALRVVTPDGAIRTVAGTGARGNSGDGGEARSATMNGPKHLCVDPDGSVVIADTENHVIRRYTPRDGRIVRVAGSGRKGADGVPGPPLEAELNQPHGVTIGPGGMLYIVDSNNHRILRVEK